MPHGVQKGNPDSAPASAPLAPPRATAPSPFASRAIAPAAPPPPDLSALPFDLSTLAGLDVAATRAEELLTRWFEVQAALPASQLNIQHLNTATMALWRLTAVRKTLILLSRRPSANNAPTRARLADDLVETYDDLDQLNLRPVAHRPAAPSAPTLAPSTPPPVESNSNTPGPPPLPGTPAMPTGSPTTSVSEIRCCPTLNLSVPVGPHSAAAYARSALRLAEKLDASMPPSTSTPTEPIPATTSSATPAAAPTSVPTMPPPVPAPHPNPPNDS